MALPLEGLPRRIIRSLTRRGLRRTIARAIEKLRVLIVGPFWFDFQRGTDTAGIVERDELKTKSPNLSHAVCCEGMPAPYFRSVIRALGLPRDGVFLDIGAGKGKALLLAAECGFRRLVGVEFSHELCCTARRNLSIHSRRSGVAIDARIVHADAAEYDVDDDANVVFLYNPFDDVVLAAVLASVRQSLERRPRTAWLLYANPIHRRLVEAQDFLEQLATFEFVYQRIDVYVSADPPPRELSRRSGGSSASSRRPLRREARGLHRRTLR